MSQQPSPNRPGRPADVRRHGFGSPEGMELTDVVVAPSGDEGQAAVQSQQQQQQQPTAAAAASPASTTTQSSSAAATPVSPTAEVARSAVSSPTTETGNDNDADEEDNTPSKPRKRRLFFTPSPRKTPSPQPQQRPPSQPSASSAAYTTPEPAARSQSSRPPTAGTAGSSARLSSGQQRQSRRRPPMATPQTGGLSGLSTTPRSSRAQPGRRSFNPLNRISDIFSPQSPSFSRTSPGLTPIHQDVSSDDGNASSASSDSSQSSVKEPFTEQVERLNELLTTPAQQLGELGQTHISGGVEDDDLDSEMEDLELSRRKLAQELSQVEFSFLGGTLPSSPKSPDSAASGGVDPKSPPKDDKDGNDDDWVPLLPGADTFEPNFSPAEGQKPSPKATSPSLSQKKRSPPKASAASAAPSSSASKSSKSGVKPGLWGRFYSSLNTPPREKREAKKKSPASGSKPSKDSSSANSTLAGEQDKKPAALKSPPRQSLSQASRAEAMKTPDRPTTGASTMSPFNPFGLGSPSSTEPSPTLDALGDSTLAVMGQSPEDAQTAGVSSASGATGGVSSLGMGGVSDGTADTGNVFQSIASFAGRLADQGGSAADEVPPRLLGDQQLASPEVDDSSRAYKELEAILTPPSDDEDAPQYVPAVTPGDKTPYTTRLGLASITPDAGTPVRSTSDNSLIGMASMSVPSDERSSSTPDKQQIPSLLDTISSAQPDHRKAEDFTTPQKSPAPRSFGQDPYVTPPQGRTQLPSLVDAATSVKVDSETGTDDEITTKSNEEGRESTPSTSQSKSRLTWGSLMNFSSAGKSSSKKESDKAQEDSPFPFARQTAAAAAAGGASAATSSAITSSPRTAAEKETVAGTTLFPMTGQQGGSVLRFPSDEKIPESMGPPKQSETAASTVTGSDRSGRPPRTPTGGPRASLQRHPTDEINIDADEARSVSAETRHDDQGASRKALTIAPILLEESDDEPIFDTDTPHYEEEGVSSPKTPSAKSSPVSNRTGGSPGTVPTKSYSGDTADKGKSSEEIRDENEKRTCQGIWIACLIIFLVVGISILVGYLTRQDLVETIQPSLSPTDMPTISSSPTRTPTPTISPSEFPTPLGMVSFITTYQIFIQNGLAASVPETDYIPSLEGAMDILTYDVLENIGNGGAQVFWQGNLRRRKLIAVLLPTEIVEVTDVPCTVGTPIDLCQRVVAEISLVDAEDKVRIFQATTELAIEIGRLQFHLDELDPGCPADIIDSRWELPAPTPFAPPTEPPSAQPSKFMSNEPSYQPSSASSASNSSSPTVAPTLPPTINATAPPTSNPSLNITSAPSASPIAPPTTNPSFVVTATPSSSPTQFELFDFLVRNSFDDGAALKNPWSPQSKAYGWLEQDVSQADYPPERILQRYAMATLFYSTQGDAWLNKDLWLSSESECIWYNEAGSRAPCNADQELVNLELDLNNLGGSLPPELGLLSSSLERLTLRGGPTKYLSNSLPSELGLLTSLGVFVVRGNELSAIIPSQIGNWTAIRQLDLSRNQFAGPLPSEIGNFGELFFFEVSANSLSGILPTEIGLMQNCKQLYFEDNALFTPIPTEIGNLGLLKEIKGGSNVLLSLPSELGRLTSADTISFQGASIPGMIPTELGNLQQLRFLELRNNVFSGRIPTEFGYLKQLRDQLDLSRNRLEGPIPSELGMLVELRGLKLQHNLLSGQVPAEISQLVKVTSVQLEGNDLTGTIPDAVCTTFNSTYPSFQADCGDFDDNCPCCTTCCADGGVDCVCRYLDTPREFLCFQQKSISP